MKGAIMQPYFLPYIGYFQLISAVDEFVVYDNIKYTKKGWINRNRIIANGVDTLISIPLKKGSDSLNVVQRELAADFNKEKLINQIKGAYTGAPQFPEIYPLIENIIRYENVNLFEYIFYSIKKICDHLDIKTKLTVSSKIEIDHTLRSQDKVIELCKRRRFSVYVNSIGGCQLYSREEFMADGIELKFLQGNIRPYSQGRHEFISHLSIIDVLMYCSKESILEQLSDYVFI